MKTKNLMSYFLLIAFVMLTNPSWRHVLANPSNPKTMGEIHYVKPASEGSCGSWAEACDLQTALTNAELDDQIWVAAGIYTPTISTDRQASFNLKTGVAIYGGFPKDGGDWHTRDWKANPTTLSGDIGSPGDDTDNSYHVVKGSYIDATAILDGFIISGGRADGTGSSQYFGAGMLNDYSSPTLTNLIFTDNSATYGGGMTNIGSNPNLSNVVFAANNADFFGGGMDNQDSSPTLNYVSFIGNTAEFAGGIYNAYSDPILTYIIFNGNIVQTKGAGIYNFKSSPSLTEVIFSENAAGEWGGGMVNINNSSPSLTNMTFSSNTAAQGAGIYNHNSNPNLINVTFSANTASVEGGGIYNYQSGPLLTHVTIYGNTAASAGGGVYSDATSSPVVKNSILWANQPNQITQTTAIAEINDCVIQGGYDDGISIITDDPLLGLLSDNGGFSLTHALNKESSAIDKADSAHSPDFDQRGHPRPIDGDGDSTAAYDIGAYEYGFVINLPLVMK